MDFASAMRRTRTAFDLVVRTMAILSGAMFLLCSGYIVIDTVGRNFFGVSTRITNEISTYVLATGVAWSLAYTLRTGGHIRIDLVFALLPQKAKDVLDILATGFMCLFAFALSYYSWDLALISFEHQTKSLTSLQAPLFIPQSTMAFGFTALTIEALLLFVSQVTPRGDRAIA